MDGQEKRRNPKIGAGDLFSRNNYIQLIKNVFNKRNKYIVFIILIIGILLMTLPGDMSDNSNDTLTAEEERLCSIISKISGCGKASVMITYNEPEKYGSTKGKPVGAIVVSEGAGTDEIRFKISEAVQAALDLPPHKVKVYKSDE